MGHIRQTVAAKPFLIFVFLCLIAVLPLLPKRRRAPLHQTVQIAFYHLEICHPHHLFQADKTAALLPQKLLRVYRYFDAAVSVGDNEDIRFPNLTGKLRVKAAVPASVITQHTDAGIRPVQSADRCLHPCSVPLRHLVFYGIAGQRQCPARNMNGPAENLHLIDIMPKLFSF